MLLIKYFFLICFIYMTLTRQIAKNTSIHLVGKIAGLFLNLLAFAFIARHLGQVGFGQFTTVMAFVQAFAIFSDWGLYMILIQMLSLPGADKKYIVGNFFTLRLISSLVFLSMAPLAALFIPQYYHLIKVGIAVTAFSFIFSSLIQLLTGFFQKELKTKPVIIAEIIGRIFLVLLVVLAIKLKLGLISILLTVVVSGAINFIFLYLFSRRFIKIGFLFNFPFWLRVLKKTWPVGLSIIFTTIYFKGDTIILSLFRSQQEVGVYGAAYRVLEALIMLPPLFMGLVLPYLTRSWSEGAVRDFRRFFQRSFDFMAIAILPLIVGLLFLARPIMVFIAGYDFAVAGEPLKVLAFAAGLIFLGSLATHVVIALEKQREMLKFYFFSALIGIAGYWFFIPRYSYWGAAAMTVAVEFLVTCSAFWVIYRTTKFFPNLRVFNRAFLSSLVMAVCLFLFPRANLFFLILTSLFVYFAGLYFFQAIDKRTIKQIVGRK